ncbi:hypothetical protein [Halorussus halophilus]|uniref:hypothetical protein n=1 Tax=Halorussus halophilus TaxID=2650975 RepID=UPI00130175B6|nr:hypothetical protein [Halorussus halophilus]
MDPLADTYSKSQTESRELPSLPEWEPYAIDIFAITAVAVVLLLVSKTPASFQNQLVQRYNDPSLHALYTTHFVHQSAEHLRGNLVSYLVTVPLTYVICLRAGRHREFRQAFLGVLFVLPPLISVVSLFGFDIVVEVLLGVDPNVKTSRGFSALDGAFVGVLLVAVADLLRTANSCEGSVSSVVGALFCIGLGGGFWNVFEYTTSVYAIVLVLLPVGYGVWLVRSVDETYRIGAGLQSGGWLRGEYLVGGLLLAGSFAAAWGVQGLLAFPWFTGGTNTLTHFVGLVAGVGMGVVCFGDVGPSSPSTNILKRSW